MEDIIQLIIPAIINNGTAVALLAYFVFRDYKYNTQLTVALNTLQLTINELREDIKKLKEVNE